MGAFLRTIPFFSNLSEEDLDRLTRIAVEIRLSKGVYLFEEGSIGRYFFVIQEGELEILMKSGDQEILIAVRGPGELIGELSLLDKMPRMASARAANDCRLLLFPREEFDRMLLSSPKVARDLLYTILPRWRHTDSVIREQERKFRAQSKELEKAFIALQRNYLELEQRSSERIATLLEQIHEHDRVIQQLRQQQAYLDGLLQQRTAELQHAGHQLRMLQEHIQQEQAIARQIQRSLGHPPPSTDLDVAYTITYAQETGKNFAVSHQFHEGGRHVFLVGEVSGNGLPAAVMAQALAFAFQLYAPKAPTPSTLMDMLSSALHSPGQITGRHCAVSCAHVEEDVLRVTNAGGVVPLLLRPDGSVARMDGQGPPIGRAFGTATPYREVLYPLIRGSVLVLVNEGVVHSCLHCSKQFGIEQLEQAIAQAPSQANRESAQAILDYLWTQFSQFQGEQPLRSDVLFLVVRW